MMSPERHSRKAYNMLVSMDNSGKETWATWIRTFLSSHGFSHVWLYQDMGDTGRFICSLKGKIIQLSVQNWQTNLHSSNRYDVYKSFKSVIMCESYSGVLSMLEMYTAGLGWEFLTCATKTDTMKMTLFAQCKTT